MFGILIPEPDKTSDITIVLDLVMDRPWVIDKQLFSYLLVLFIFRNQVFLYTRFDSLVQLVLFLSRRK